LSDDLNTYSYRIDTLRFSITQTVNGVETLVVNPVDALYFEQDAKKDKNDDDGSSRKLFGSEKLYLDPTYTSKCFTALEQSVEHTYRRNVFKRPSEDDVGLITGGIYKSIGLGFFFPTDKMFGLPEREDTFMLKSTLETDPYQIFASDNSAHPYGDPQPLSGAFPYLTGVSKE
jgi:hypothetical protein